MYAVLVSATLLAHSYTDGDDAMATNIYGSAKSHYSVFMGYFVDRE